MEKVRELLKNPLYVGVAAGVLGLIVGWLVIGWALWPVTYYDAAPANMRKDLQVDYLRMAIDSYSKNQDATLAKRRFQDLGANATTYLEEIRKAPGKTFPDDIGRFSNALALPAGQPVVQVTTIPGTVVPGTPAAGTKAPAVTQPTMAVAPAADEGGSSILLVVLCIVLLVIGGALAYVFLLRNKKGGDLMAMFRGGAKPPAAVQQPEYQAQGAEAPIAQFMTTYKLGVDLYDDSFSIDSPTGEFLGECGVGISKNIGVGDPKKVTAFEVWLFDKNDIQTVTKVLMSENAYNDQPTLNELQAKGEPVLITPGSEVYLQTATLQLTARVVDMNYGQGALPQNSFFDRLTLELAIWPKPAQ
jgi:hypothetical protein